MKEKKNLIDVDIVWFLYLLMIFLLPNIVSGSHYFATLLILIFSLYNAKKRILFNKRTIIYIITYLVLTIYIALSTLWVTQIIPSQKSTIISMFEIVIMLYCLSIYISDNSKLEKLSNTFVLSTITTGIIYYILSPINTWGTTMMGEKLAIYRNTAGYYFSFAGIINLFINGKKNKKSFIISLILFIMAIGTGSRKVFVHIALSFIFYALLQNKLSKSLKYFLIGIIVCIIIYEVTINIPYFYNLYNNRLFLIFAGKNSDDSSTIVRTLMREYAFDLFLKKPILGHGVSGFEVWLSGQYDFLMKWAMGGTYSHCNYTELLANHGIIGFSLFYIPIFVTLIKGLRAKLRKGSNVFLNYGLSIIAVFLVLDYASISYFYKIYIFILFLGISAIKVNTDGCHAKGEH